MCHKGRGGEGGKPQENCMYAFILVTISDYLGKLGEPRLNQTGLTD